MVITYLDCNTGIGTNREESASAYRAGVGWASELDHFGTDAVGSPLRGYDSGFEIAGFLVAELLETVANAIDALEKSGRNPRKIFSESHFILAVPSDEDARFDEHYDEPFLTAERFIKGCSSLFGLEISKNSCTVISDGNCSVVSAFVHAHELLESGANHFCILACDSFTDADSLEFLEEQEFLVSGGILPAQASGIILIENPAVLHGEQCKPLLSIDNLIYVDENPSYDSEEYKSGEILSMAIQELSLNQPIETLFSDFNGEKWRALEVANARVRCSRSFSPNCYDYMPAESFGHVGTATGLIHLACIVHYFDKKLIPPTPVLCSFGDWNGTTAIFTAELPE